MTTIYGDDRSNTISYSRVNYSVTLYGLAGDDTLTGGYADDYVYGGNGNDTLSGSYGNDYLDVETGTYDRAYGGSGNDILVSESSAAWLYGGNDNDTIEATGSGYQAFYGGYGNDRLTAGEGDNVILGGAGDDILNGGEGDNGLWGDLDVDHTGSGNDQLYAYAGTNSLVAGGGNDLASFSLYHASTVVGGSGWDVAIMDGSGVYQDITFDALSLSSLTYNAKPVTWLGYQGYTQSASVLLDGQVAVRIAEFEVYEFMGGSGDDNVRLGGNDDILGGGEGDDLLQGGGGADQISGGQGFDQLFGGDGDDVLDGGADYSVIFGGSGDDEITSSVGYSNVDAGSGDDLVVVAVGAGINLVGGDGYDTFQLTHTGKAAVKLDVGLTTTQTIADYQFDTDSLDFADLYLGGSVEMSIAQFEAFNFTLGAGADQVTTGWGNDILNGGAGSDTLNAGDGDDTILGGAGADKLRGGLGSDDLSGGAGNDRFIYADVAESDAANGIDTLLDFAKGDKIDLSAIEAVDGAGAASAFRFIGSASFTAAGQVRAYADGSGQTIVEANTDASLSADMRILLDGSVALTAANFIL